MGQGLWNPAQGPQGADPTAFYEDEQGRYWLGTGSSGGVYRSADKGESWVAINEGIGPAHVSWIGKIEGKLYIELADEDSLVDSWQTTQHFRVYEYIGAGGASQQEAWSPITDNKENEKLVQQAKRQSEARYREIKPKLPNLPSALYERADKEAYINQFGQSEEPTPWGLGSTEGSPSPALLNQAIIPAPPATSFLRHWNFYQTRQGHLVCLGRYGVYELSNSVWMPLGNKGLVATDVYAVESDLQGNTYTQTNYLSIEKLNQGKWSQLAYNSPKGWLTPSASSFRINKHSNGKLITVANGEVVELRGDSLQVVLPKQQYTKESLPPTLLSYLQQRHSYVFRYDSLFTFSAYTAAFHRNGKLWAYGKLNGVLLLLQFENGEFASVGIPEMPRYWEEFGYGSFLASNPVNGDVWFFGDKHAIWLDYPNIRYPFHLDYMTGQLGQLVAFSNDGKLAYPLITNSHTSEADQVYLIKTRGSSVEAKSYYAPLKSITCMGFDKKGNLFAGTGYYSINSADYCAWGLKGKAYGLYKLDDTGWRAVLEEPNQWILSLAVHPEEGLWVGTSGSGLWQYRELGAPSYPALAKVYSNGLEGIERYGYPLIPSEYSSIQPYQQYYELHGNLSHIRYAKEASPDKYWILQLPKSGRWKIGNQNGVISNLAYDGFCHTPSGTLLAYNIIDMETSQWSDDENAVFDFYRVDAPDRIVKLPYHRLWSFEKGNIGEVVEEDGSSYFQLCDFQLRAFAYNRFSYFQQINRHLILAEGEESYLWSLEDWEQERKLNAARVLPSNGAVHIAGNPSMDQQGLIEEGSWQMLMPLESRSISPFGRHFLINSQGKQGLYDPSRQKVVLDVIYDEITNLSRANSVYFVEKQGRVGAFNWESESWIVKPEYKHYTAPARRMQQSSKKASTEWEDNWESEDSWGFSASPRADAFALPEVWEDSLGNKGFFDRAQAKWILEPGAYDKIEYLFDGYYIISIGEKQGLFDLDREKWALPSNGFVSIAPMESDFAGYKQTYAGHVIVEKPNQKLGLYALHTQKWILDSAYQQIEYYNTYLKEKVFIVKKAGKYGIWSTTKGLVIPIKYPKIEIDPENKDILRIYKKANKRPKKEYEITGEVEEGAYE